ncbi:siderophore ABC transporter substrate-binding protein [Agrobacterium sp. AGB01]|nr:siderophore ABC transporter substrate-binding protein [Agrobacterium sp. AGB01]MBD9388235.1 siderophore ABC transporter substrate-binding protein [Agrobacterium sp. AGB01]
MSVNFKPLHPARLFAVAAFGFGALTANAQDISIKHGQGETVLKGVPQKVLVLDIPSLDTMDALGVEPAGVLASNLPAYLSKYSDAKYLKVGTLFEPDYEAINAAEADLAIVGGRSRAKYPEVSAIVPALDMSVDAQNYIASTKTNILTLGKVFGKDAEAAKLDATIDEKIAALKAVAADAGTAMILVTNAGKVGAYGPNSRVGWLHKEVGFKTVAEDIDDRFHGGDIVSFEYLLEANPDWLFVVDRDAGVGNSGGDASQKVLDNELVHQTTAWKKGQIVYLDPQAAYIVSSGYTALTMLIDQVYKAVSEKK